MRHVGPEFAQDPLRVLRLARFAGRFQDFSIAPETRQACRDISASGELQSLSPERVWREFQRGILETDPVRFLHEMKDLGVLAALFPDLDRLAGVPQPLQYHPEGTVQP